MSAELHLLGHRIPAKPSLDLSGMLLPGLLGTLLKKGFPHSRLPLELHLHLQDGFMDTAGEKRKKGD